MRILTIIIHAELSDDTLVEVKSSALNMRGSVAELNLAKWLEKSTNLLGSGGSSKLALNKEETWKRVNVHSSMLSRDKKLTMSLCLLAAAWTTLDQTASALLDGALSMLRSLKFDQQKLLLKMNVGGLTVYWQKANGICFVSRRILTKTGPNSRKI